MSQFRLYVCAAVGAALLFTIAAEAAPHIEVTPAGLRATGITPGGVAVWFGLTVDSFAMSPRLNRYAEIVRDADGDGVVAYDAAKITRFTLMFVADATTGEHAVFRAEGVEAIEHDLRGNNWRAGLEHFDIPADFLEVLLVRPSEGAWKASVFEGHREDADGRRNGKFRLKLKDLEPIGDVAGKKLNGNVRRGDLLVIVDPRSFACAVRAAGD